MTILTMLCGVRSHWAVVGGRRHARVLACRLKAVPWMAGVGREQHAGRGVTLFASAGGSTRQRQVSGDLRWTTSG